MKELHIMNPAAGKGALPDRNSLSGEVYVTTGKGDAERYCAERLSDGDEYIVRVYGGDGTLHEVVNGIMRAGAGDRVTLVPVPTGSGNDFERMTCGICDPSPCDVIKYNGTYAINEINMGFDTEAVINMEHFRGLPLVGGSLAYILGVAKALISKHSTPLRISIVKPDGGRETFEGKYLLCLLSNGQWYGGGFMAAPTADISDGELDMILVNDVSRRTFVSLVGKYRAGKHLDVNKKAVAAGLEHILIFRRCKSVVIEGIEQFSADGEILDANGKITAEAVRSAISVAGVKMAGASERETV